ncbi:hypothetical protein HDU93_008988 [Gonapodya sp. JEL0774]|nr:hypothetical protein HDU93_008988 [Gonapodya sp. JEL0774]
MPVDSPAPASFVQLPSAGSSFFKPAPSTPSVRPPSQSERESQYAAKLVGLNRSFIDHLQQVQGADPGVDLSKIAVAAARQYAEMRKEVESEFKDVVADVKPETSASLPLANQSHGTTKPSAVAAPPAPPAPPAFVFGAPRGADSVPSQKPSSLVFGAQASSAPADSGTKLAPIDLTPAAPAPKFFFPSGNSAEKGTEADKSKFFFPPTSSAGTPPVSGFGSPPAFGGFKFTPTTSPASTTSSSTGAVTATAFGFGTFGGATASISPGGSTASTFGGSITTPAFNFGLPTAATGDGGADKPKQAPFSGFSFTSTSNSNSASTASSSAPLTFSFGKPTGGNEVTGSAGPFVFNIPAQAQAGQEDEDGGEGDEEFEKENPEDKKKLASGAGEENETTVYEFKSNIFAFDKSNQNWIKQGTGQARLKRDNSTGKLRILARSDNGTILLNVAIPRGAQFTLSGTNSIIFLRFDKPGGPERVLLSVAKSMVAEVLEKLSSEASK